MVSRDHLTSEYLKKLFKDNFQLANHAIALSKQMVKGGREMTLESVLRETENTSELKQNH